MGWCPFRSIDRRAALDFTGLGNGRFLSGIYNKAVPLAVLLTIDKIEEAMKSAVEKPAFFISDYEARRPDPFLLVTVPSLGLSQYSEPDGTGTFLRARPEPSCFVIERWDEPSFR